MRLVSNRRSSRDDERILCLAAVDTVDTSISVLHITSYAVVQYGVAAYLDKQAFIRALHHVTSLDAAGQVLAGDDGVDVAIVDLMLLKPSGLSDIRSLLKGDPGLKIIVLSRSEQEPFVTQSMENGALGYVSMKCSADELIEAIQTVYRNEKYLSRDVAYGYAMASLNKTDNPILQLTTREYQVFTLLAKGTTIAEVAAQLFISPKTVHVYRTNIFTKLKLSSAFELTLLALRHGVISTDVLDS